MKKADRINFSLAKLLNFCSHVVISHVQYTECLQNRKIRRIFRKSRRSKNVIFHAYNQTKREL